MKAAKTLAALIVAKAKPAPKEAEATEEAGPAEGKVAAMEEFIAAVKAGDAEAAVQAWETYEEC